MVQKAIMNCSWIILFVCLFHLQVSNVLVFSRFQFVPGKVLCWISSSETLRFDVKFLILEVVVNEENTKVTFSISEIFPSFLKTVF